MAKQMIKLASAEMIKSKVCVNIRAGNAVHILHMNLDNKQSRSSPFFFFYQENEAKECEL